WDAGWIVLASGFLLLPLLMVVTRGAPGMFDLPPEVFGAALRSFLVALAAAALTLGLALPLAFAAFGLRERRLTAGLVEGVGYLALAASPLVIGTGLFIVLFGWVNPVTLALPVTALVNAVMALPFALRALVPAVAQIEAQFGPLADSLAMTGWSRFRHVHAARLRRPMGFAAGLAAALSMGDLGVITLFSDGERATLPLLLYRLMAAYRMDQAAGVALLLLGLSLVMFWLFDRGGRMNAET
ncbi:MAG: thiamine/thiamine pyrophosphate ABC transporter permease ThiP, partial [Paracoccaceae bacterium]